MQAMFVSRDSCSPRAPASSQETGRKTISSSQRTQSHAAVSLCHSNIRLNNTCVFTGDSGPLSPTFVTSITG